MCSQGYFPALHGGAERQAQLQAEELARRGHHVEVVCPRDEGAYVATINGVRVWRLPCIRGRHLTSATFLPPLAVFLLARLRHFDAAMIHLAHYNCDVIVAMTLATRRPSWVRLAASGPFGEIARMRRFSAFSRYFGLRHATRVQAISSELRKEAAAIGVPSSRIVSIPNGVNLSDWPVTVGRSNVDARRSLGLPETGPLLLYAGRLSNQKGVPDLLDAWTHVSTEGATLVMVGSFATMDTAGSIAPQPGVIVRDSTTDIRKYYAAADAVVLPSRASEGMSNVLLESMASGLAVIATRVGAAPEMIADGEDGLLVPPDSPTHLAAAIRRVLADPQLRAAMGRAARRRVEREFTIEAVVGQILAELTPLVLPHPVSDVVPGQE